MQISCIKNSGFFPQYKKVKKHLIFLYFYIIILRVKSKIHCFGHAVRVLCDRTPRTMSGGRPSSIKGNVCATQLRLHCMTEKRCLTLFKCRMRAKGRISVRRSSVGQGIVAEVRPAEDSSTPWGVTKAQGYFVNRKRAELLPQGASHRRTAKPRERGFLRGNIC